MKRGIYLIKNKINNHSYVGMSKDIKNRWKHHCHESNNPNSKEYQKTLYRAFRKYGINNFEFIVLEYCDEKQLREKEIYFANRKSSFRKDNYFLLYGFSSFFYIFYFDICNSC